jgi:hypothetical protein
MFLKQYIIEKTRKRKLGIHRRFISSEGPLECLLNAMLSS